VPVDGNDNSVQMHRKPEAKVRSYVVRAGLGYYARRSRIAYSQARPTDLRWPRFVHRLDCSGLVAACMNRAKVLPSVDWRWTNTWVQIRLGRPVTAGQAKPGDIVFYGTSASNPTHEALFLGTRKQLRALGIKPPAAMNAVDKYVLSNGHYPMGIYALDYRDDRVAIRSVIGPGGRI